MTDTSPTDILVECHSGYTYAQRPTALVWQGKRREIESVLAEWNTPQGKHFRVSTQNGLIFELVFKIASDEWQVLRS